MLTANQDLTSPIAPQEPRSTPRWGRYLIVLIAAAILAILVYFMRDNTWIYPPPPAEDKAAVRVTHSYLTRSPADPKFTATITLRNLQGDNATARATRWYRDPVFSIEIQAERLAALPAGSTYAAWVFKDEAGSDPVYIGEVRSNDTEKDIFKAGLALSRKDFPDYKKVIITIEKAHDLKPEKRILEGDFN